MPTVAAARQKIYNQRHREKKAKIKAFSRQLDDGVNALEKLPKCPACGAGVHCAHTPERHKLLQEIELVRAQLEQVEH